MRRRGFLYTLATSPLLAATAAGMMAAHPSDQAVTAADDPLAHHRAKIRVGELTTVIGDNESDPPGQPWSDNGKWRPLKEVTHRSGFNGLWSLESVHRPGNVFLPYAAGMNYEFIYDGHVGAPQFKNRDLIFEPRSAPMTYRRVNQNAVHLHQPPTPFWGLESWTELTVREPYYIDMKFEFMPSRIPSTTPPRGTGISPCLTRRSASATACRCAWFTQSTRIPISQLVNTRTGWGRSE